MTRNRRFGVGAAVLVLAIGYLVYAGVETSSVYYFTIGEFLEKRDSLANESVRVAGRVAPGSVQKSTSETGTELRFSLGEFVNEAPAGGLLAVQYHGVLPDMFAEGRDVIVEGKLENGILRAKSVMTSCPSKYEGAPAEGAQAKAPS